MFLVPSRTVWVARAAIAWAAAAALVAPVRADAYGWLPVPAGYTIIARHDLSAGLVHVTYRSASPRRIVNVAFHRHIGPEHVRMVLSNEMVSGPAPRTEVVSSMCRRVRCRIAVNGDFFSRTTGQPVGGVAIDGVPIRTPPGVRYHFGLDWSGGFSIRKIGLPTYLYASYGGQTKTFLAHSVNTPRGADRSVVFTPRWGPATETNQYGFEIVMKVLNPPIVMDRPLRVRMVRGSAAGNALIPSDGLVVSGHGIHASLLANLWRDVTRGAAAAEAQLALDSTPDLRTYTGGSPALLLAGRQAFTSDGSAFMTVRSPKTMVGRNSVGDAILAVVDGRQTDWSVGMTMTEAAAFMRSLGALDALNLDGGGSSSFVMNGVVMNRPSDGRERAVATALAIVP